MADYAQYFLQQADAAFQRKQQLYDQILQAILTEELKTPAVKKAELELLAREETRLRSMEEALRDQQLQGIKQDAELLKVISEEQGGIAKANIAFNEAVKTATIRSKTELAVERSKMERLIEEAAINEKAKADALKAAGQTAAGTFGTGAFATGISADDAKNTARDYLATLWSQSFDSKLRGAETEAQRQAVVDSFKQASADWMSRQGSGVTAAMLKDPDIQKAAIDEAIRQVGATDRGRTAEQIIEDEKARAKAGIRVPSGVGAGGGRGVDEQIILSRQEKLRTILGIDEKELKNLAVDLGDGSQTKFEDFLTTAAYNRIGLGNPDVADEFYKKYPSAEDFRNAIRSGKGTDAEKALVEETEPLDATTLKQLYSGELATGYRELRRRQADLEDRRRALQEGIDAGLTFEGAVQKARYLYRKLYGPEKVQTGLEAADTIRKELAGKSEEEQAEILNALPIDDRQKQILLKAAAGSPITDTELRKLQVTGPPGATALSAKVIDKLAVRLPGFIREDGSVLLSYDESGMPVTKPQDELTLGDLGDAFVAYGEEKGEVVDQTTIDKIKEAADLLEKLSKTQPYAAPMMNFQVEKSLDKVLEGIPGVKPPAPVEPLIKLPTRKPRPAAEEEAAMLAPSDVPFNVASNRRLEATRMASSDVLTTAAGRAKEVSGKAPRVSDVIKGVEVQLADLPKPQRDLVVELGKQSGGLKPEQVQKNLSKIVNPLTDPEAFQKAVAYLGIASNEEYNNLVKKDQADRIKKELKLLA